MIDTLPLLAYTVGPLFFAALVVRFLALPLRTFQAVYLIAGAAWILLHYTFLPSVPILWPIIILIVGEVFQLLMIGLLGNKLGPNNYASLLLLVGLFPWYLGVAVSGSYVALFFLFTAVLSTVRYKLAVKRTGLELKNPAAAARQLKGEELDKFQKGASVIFSLPGALAALTVAAFTFM